MEENFEIEKPVKPFFAIAARYGVFSGLGLIILAILLKIASYGNAFNLIWYIALFFLGALFISMHHARKNEFETLSYGKAFRFGLFISLFVALSLGVYSFTTAAFIDTEWIKNSAIETEEKIAETIDNIPETYRGAIEESIDQMYKTTPVDIAWGMMFNTAFLGLLFSAILAIFMRTKKSSDSFEDDLK